jgi:thioredoxin 1
MRSVISNVSKRVEDVDFFYVDLDESPELGVLFRVMSVPTLTLINNGKEVKRHIGDASEEAVKEWVRASL